MSDYIGVRDDEQALLIIRRMFWSFDSCLLDRVSRRYNPDKAFEYWCAVPVTRDYDVYSDTPYPRFLWEKFGVYNEDKDSLFLQPQHWQRWASQEMTECYYLLYREQSMDPGAALRKAIEKYFEVARQLIKTS
jgi:hypothetical protein